MTFRNQRLRSFAVPMNTTWLRNDLAEARGQQELHTRQSPQGFNAPAPQHAGNRWSYYNRLRDDVLSFRLRFAPARKDGEFA